MRHARQSFLLFLCAFAVFLAGCSKEPAQDASVNATAAPAKSKARAAQIETAFSSAPVEVRENATIASDALKVADYEKAVVSLQVLKEQGNLTFDQGMAIHNSMVSLESRLISAMAQGDENARRAYDLLKKSKRQ